MFIIHEHTKNQLITYIYILYFQFIIKFKFLANLAGFPAILNYINRNGGFGTAKAPNLGA